MKRQSRWSWFSVCFRFLIAAWWIFALRSIALDAALPFAAILAGVGATWARIGFGNIHFVLYASPRRSSYGGGRPASIRVLRAYANCGQLPNGQSVHAYVNEHVD